MGSTPSAPAINNILDDVKIFLAILFFEVLETGYIYDNKVNAMFKTGLILPVVIRLYLV